MSKTKGRARREPDSWRPPPVLCPVCGSPTGAPPLARMGPSWAGIYLSPTTYCSNACRQKAYRQRVKQLKLEEEAR